MTSTYGRGRLARSTAPWLLPPGVFALVYLGRSAPLGGAASVAAIIAAFGMVRAVSHHPIRSLTILCALLPFHLYALAGLYSLGLPAGLVGAMRFWRDLLLIGLAVSAIREHRSSRQGLDAIDVMSIVYVGFVALYAALPLLFAANAPGALDVRVAGFRQNAGFVVVLLAVRHTSVSREQRERLVRVLAVTGLVVASLAVVELIYSDGWNDFVVNRLRVIGYQRDVLGSLPLNMSDIRIYVPGTSHVRIGGVFDSAVVLPFFLFPCLAIGVVWLSRARSAVLSSVTSCAAVLAIIATQTRSAVLGVVVLGLVVLRLLPRSQHELRARLTMVAFAAGLALVPLVASSGLGERLNGSDQQSNQEHSERSAAGLADVLDRPLGNGLGTSYGVGSRYDVPGQFAPENTFLVLSLETGLIPVLVLIGALVLVGRELTRRAKAGDDLVAMAAAGAGAGLLAGSIVLQPFVELAVSWTVFALIGLALAPRVSQQPAGPGPEASALTSDAGTGRTSEQTSSSRFTAAPRASTTDPRHG